MKRDEDFLQRLYDVIPIGKENAISVKALSDYFEVTARELKSLILRARQQGYMICSLASEQKGYYKPTDIVEVHQCYKMFEQRARTTESVLLSIREYLIHNGINPDTAKDERFSGIKSTNKGDEE